MKSRTIAGLALVLAGLAAPARPQQVVFRSTVDSVTVDVSVRERGREVTDLTAADFELSDNDVPQRILDVSREALPVDVTFVVDLSGSVQGPLLEALTRAIEQVGQRLRAIDRVAVLTFNNRIRQMRPLAAGPLPIPVGLGTPTGQTSLFDSVTISLMQPPESGRRRMVIIFTDGRDGTSFVDGTTLVDLARRSEMAIFTVAAVGGPSTRRPRAPHQALFDRLAELTGGAVVALRSDQNLGESFVQAFEEFRSSYVLRYAYEGPARPGWHQLVVRVTRRGQYDVRARQGYFAGN